MSFQSARCQRHGEMVLMNYIGRPDQQQKKEGKKGNLLLDDSLSICPKMDALVMRSESARAIRPIQSSFRMIIVIIIVIRLLFIKSNLFTATKRHCKLRHCTADNVIASFKWKRRQTQRHNANTNSAIESDNLSKIKKSAMRQGNTNEHPKWIVKYNRTRWVPRTRRER